MDKEFKFALEGFYPREGSGLGQDRFNFSLYLDKELAKKLKEIKIDSETRNRFQEIAKEEILHPLGMKWPSPYSFYEDSLLITQIYLESDGRWLSTNHSDLVSLDKNHFLENNIAYHSHNIDTSLQAYALLGCFTKWLNYTDVFTDKD